jgi:altronate hydrolase
MAHQFVRIHENDNVLVALQDLSAGLELVFEDITLVLPQKVQAKHKFTMRAMNAGDPVFMYGVLVGKVTENLEAGSVLTTENLKHAASSYTISEHRNPQWQVPDVAEFQSLHFMGYHRSNGAVGTANYWLVIPLVFCENRNIEVLKEAVEEAAGFKKPNQWQTFARQVAVQFENGKDLAEILQQEWSAPPAVKSRSHLFPHVDGVKFITHAGGCGGTRSDAQALCALIAGYITHPNVAGATVLSLGCQNAQASMLRAEIEKRDPSFSKPLVLLEQQKMGTEDRLLGEAIKQTFVGLAEANRVTRQPAPLSKLVLGLECGGSDGFSGISANPAIGYTSDLLVALGGSVILSEFPELCGVEQELSDRCVARPTAEKFHQLMGAYEKRAIESGSGFDMNPSPGNIKDGLITDAIKSAGAAKKGGTSPVVDVLDYTEPVTKPGLNLLCTPGNDVESTTAEVGSGANVVLFTTGLGTPTGNPIAPVLKVSSNTKLYQKMNDIIDLNAGTIIDGEETIEACGRRFLHYVIQVASGEIPAKSVLHGQDDFIPWKRGVSL